VKDMIPQNPVIERILRAVGQPVNFRYPAGERHLSGLLVDRAVVDSTPDAKAEGVHYWDVVDLIEFKNEKNRLWIRIGYYRVVKGRLVFASQTTITEPVETWKRVLVEAANHKPWFRDLLVSVVAELKK
jgi:hypothetical protein